MSPFRVRRRSVARGLLLLATLPIAPGAPARAAATASSADGRQAGFNLTGHPMLVVSGTMSFRQDRLDEAKRQAMEIMAKSAAEPGCRTYELSATLRDPLTFRLFEEWEDAEALTAHFETAHFKAFAAALPNLLSAAPSFSRYDVADVRPLR